VRALQLRQGLVSVELPHPDGQLGGEPRQQVDGAPGCGRRQALPAEGATGRRQAGRTRQAAGGAATLGLLQRRPARSGADLATGLPDLVPLPEMRSVMIPREQRHSATSLNPQSSSRWDLGTLRTRKLLITAQNDHTGGTHAYASMDDPLG